MSKDEKSHTRTYDSYNEVQIKIPNRIIFLGASGSGKTNIMINLLLKMNCFETFHFVVKDDEEPLYKMLFEHLRKIEKKVKTQILWVYYSVSQLPQIEEFDKEKNNIVILDDQILDMENKKRAEIAKSYLMRGRKQNISTWFLSQSYFGIPKFVRQNSDCVVFKKLNGLKDKRMILKEYCSNEITADQLQEMVDSIDTSNITEFFMIDNTRTDEYKFRHNLSPMPIPS